VLAHRIDGPADAPALVLAGSLGTTLAVWEPQVSLLGGLRLVRYDHPGHGGSPLPSRGAVTELATAVVELLDYLELGRVSICGLSLGGAVAMQVALQAPARVDRLVLASSAARFPNAESYGDRATLVRREGLEPIADVVMERWFTPGFRRMEADTVRRYRAMLVSTSAEGYARGCEAVRDWDATHDVRGIAAHTLVVAGAADPATPPSVAADLAAAVPGARSLVLPDAAHLASVEQPAAFSDAVLEHLRA
jgi:3-oxoadipate enol-lactonase